MKIEAGYYKTRNGKKARVLCNDAPGDYSIVGYLILRDEPTIETWTSEGAYSSYKDDGHELDLVEPWVDPRPKKVVYEWMVYSILLGQWEISHILRTEQEVREVYSKFKKTGRTFEVDE